MSRLLVVVATVVSLRAAPLLAEGEEESFFAVSLYGDATLYRLNPDDGTPIEMRDVLSEEALFGGLTLTRGALYCIDGFDDARPDRFMRIFHSGNTRVVGEMGRNWSFRAIAFDPLGETFYAALDNALYAINGDTGEATLVAALDGPGLDWVTAMAIRADGAAFLTDTFDTGLYRLNLETGAAAYLGDLRPGEQAWYQDLSFDSKGRLWAVRDGGGMVRIDVETVREEFLYDTPLYGGIAIGRTHGHCTYRVKRGKGVDCDSCPERLDDFPTDESCESVRDCAPKITMRYPCPGPGPGRCRVTVKRYRCDW